MNWSLPNFTAPPDAEEIFNQMCGRNAVDVALVNYVGSEDAHTIFQLGTLARQKFAQHYQPGRKSRFTPATLLEKLESDKGDETDILEDDKIQLLDSLHIQHGRLTNREIAFILAIRAIHGIHAGLHLHLRSDHRPPFIFVASKDHQTSR